jgi:hypothetical protein
MRMKMSSVDLPTPPKELVQPKKQIRKFMIVILLKYKKINMISSHSLPAAPSPSPSRRPMSNPYRKLSSPKRLQFDNILCRRLPEKILVKKNLYSAESCNKNKSSLLEASKSTDGKTTTTRICWTGLTIISSVLLSIQTCTSITWLTRISFKMLFTANIPSIIKIAI